MPKLANVNAARTASAAARPRPAPGRSPDPGATTTARASRAGSGVADPGQRDGIPAVVWARPDMRRRLSERDIAGVYRLLQAHGVSQRAIAARTGQSQSEVSETLGGRRQVAAYDLLVRIAEGLGAAIPAQRVLTRSDRADGPLTSTTSYRTVMHYRTVRR